ncbi:MAG: aminotransferase class I/II-fold pyridoxal phosphate-dependent enzyme [Isosphaeraceae bacterium]|nr:aminotransferase class I/II-fold pyridoxal phosphate-dependent enzyme [Isosphaeraceae bacterium]
MRPIPHGGNSAGVRRRLGLGEAPLLDFSTSLNPLGPPPRALAAARDALNGADRYPELGAPRLTERLAERHGVPVDRVIVGAGTTELIGLIAQSLREVLALHALQRGDPMMPVSHLVEPTYGEYRRVSVLNELRTEAWGGHVLGWTQEGFPSNAAGVFWTGHPNNPTGRVWERKALLESIDASLGLLTVVDEAFLPFLPDEEQQSLVSAVPERENLLVLRSLTKIHALPGLRVGYAVASADMVTRLRQYQDPWTITGAAEAAALEALDDREHGDRTVRFVAEEATRVEERLWDIPGLRPAWPERDRPGDAHPLPNFLLVSLIETAWTAPQVHDALALRGILVRECSDFAGLEVGALLTGPDQLVATQGHLRIGLRGRADNDRLLAALRDVLASEPPGASPLT